MYQLNVRHYQLRSVCINCCTARRVSGERVVVKGAYETT